MFEARRWITAPGAFAVALVLLATTPSATDAQQTGKVWRVGVLTEGPRSSVFDRMFPPELRALGWVENENVTFERRHAEGRPERLPELAADLVRAKPDLILAFGNPETAAAKRATSSIPIVMMFGLQPIETGLVPSLARPSGNVTGMVWVTTEYAGKLLQVLKEAVPNATTVALLWDPTNPGHGPAVRAELEHAARALGVTVRYVDIRNVDDFDGAFATIEKLRPSGVIVATTLVVHQRRGDVPAFMAKHRLPAIYTGRGFVDAGGLLSYSPNLVDSGRRVATFVDRILKGARAWRFSHRTADEIRIGGQSQEREVDCVHNSAVALVACGSGTRLTPWSSNEWRRTSQCTGPGLALLASAGDHGRWADKQPRTGRRRLCCVWEVPDAVP